MTDNATYIPTQRTAPPTTSLSSAPKNPPRRRVMHVYDKREGVIAAQMGVHVKMLCGVWGAPSSRPDGNPVTLPELSPRHCKRCTRILASHEQERVR